MVNVRRVPASDRRWSLAAFVVAAGLAPALAGCILTADKLDPALDVPERYKEAPGKPHAALPALEWWRSFRSTELTDLVEQAQVANLDIAAAVARIVQADALSRVAGAPLLPTVNANASDTRSRPSAVTGTNAIAVIDRTLYSVSLSASYEIDFWGKNRAALRAAEYSALGSRFDREVVALTALVTVANTYFTVLGAQDRLRIANENVASASRILSLIRDRFNAGTASALDLAQQETLVLVQRATIPPLIEQIRQNMAMLALLAGRAPEHMSVRGGSLERLAFPRVTPGLPSELLTQRPDIREAEARLAGSDANVEAARAAFYPSIQLTGQGGSQSAALHALFGSGAFFYSIAVSATQPIFDGGRLLGQLDQQKGVRDELLQNYRKSVISAFTDVEKALVAVQQTTVQERLQRQAVDSSRRAFELAEERLRAGTVDLTTVLTTQQTLFQQQDTLAQVRLARFLAMVSLYQALGGGWLPPREARATP